MNSDAHCGFFSLAEERFDFDVSLSPASSKGDEDEDDEVFVGPVGHKERCITVGVETLVKESCSSSGRSLGVEPSWSPLSGDGFDEICKQAHQLANQLEGGQQRPDDGGTNGTDAESKEEPKEHFVLDSGAKLGIFSRPVDVVLSPIKRETFCVQDSPMKQLPPAVQQRLLRANGAVCSAGGTGSAKAGVGSVSTSSPVRGAKSQNQPQMVLRGRAGLASARGPPAGTATASLSTRTRPGPAEKKIRLPVPSKGSVGSRRSLAGRASSRVEDRLSDAASVGSDVSDSSLNSSLHGKRALAPPNKSGRCPPAAGTAPPPQTRRTRNTSSSSSSVSSFNSSLSVSPLGKAKLNSSLNTSISGPSGRVPTNVSRLVNPGGPAAKNRKSLLVGRAPDAPPPSTAGARRSISTQGRRASEAERPPLVRSTPLKRPAAPLQQTPAKRAMERASSVPNVSSPPSVVRAKPKLMALVAPTPTSQLRGPCKPKAVSSPDGPRTMKPKRLIAVCSVDSLPQKSAAQAPGLQTPSAGGLGSLQSKLRRPSALPTPVNRRMSGIPGLTPQSRATLSQATLTPQSLARPLKTSNLPGSATRDRHWSPAQVKSSRQPQAAAPGEEAGLQPCSLVFSLDDEPEQHHASAPQPAPQETPQTAPQETPQTAPQETPQPAPQETPQPAPQETPQPAPQETPQPDLQETPGRICPVSQNPPEPSTELQGNQENQDPELTGESEQLQHPETTGMKMQEVNQVQLVDAPAPVLRPAEKLLIDLSNTPVLLRPTAAKTSAGQLIDLSSPLIKWSPEDKKGTATDDAPLINLSF